MCLDAYAGRQNDCSTRAVVSLSEMQAFQLSGIDVVSVSHVITSDDRSDTVEEGAEHTTDHPRAKGRNHYHHNGRSEPGTTDGTRSVPSQPTGRDYEGQRRSLTGRTERR